MELNNILLVGSFLLSVLAAIIALSKRKSEVNLSEANEADKISAAWERLNGPNEKRIQDLETRLKDALCTIESMKIDFGKKAEDLQGRLDKALAKIQELQNKLTAATKRITELETENAELRRQNNGGRGLLR